jgi:XTP/dITP diphosphohydrolase
LNIILASSNKGKLAELKVLLPVYTIYTMKEIVGNIEIVEDGNSFKQNASIKAQAIYDIVIEKALFNKDDFVVISDDSGISVPILNNEPNIYSARYAGENATDKQNNQKLILKLKENNIKKTTAYYTASICMMYKNTIYTTHGWMYGNIIDKEIGSKGFGYDPIFIPNDYSKTLGELDHEIKKQISHRTKALNLMKKLMKIITKNNN